MAHVLERYFPGVGRMSSVANCRMGSVFEPLGDEPLAGVYVYLTQPSGAGVHELVRHAGGHHHHLAAPRLDDFLARGERGGALLHHEDLLVGMPVQLRAAPGGASTTMNETPESWW